MGDKKCGHPWFHTFLCTVLYFFGDFMIIETITAANAQASDITSTDVTRPIEISDGFYEAKHRQDKLNTILNERKFYSKKSDGDPHDQRRRTQNIGPIEYFNNECPSNLLAGFAESTGSYGNMFDVKTKESPIKIVTIEFYTDRTFEVGYEVWSKTDSFIGYLGDYDAWEKISQGTIKGNGKNVGTEIPKENFMPVEMGAFESRAFYVTLTTPDMRYAHGNGTAFAFTDYLVDVENDDIQIYEGIGVSSYPFDKNQFFSPRRFLGTFKYLSTQPCPVEPTKAPTPFPTFDPTDSPTLNPISAPVPKPTASPTVAETEIKQLEKTLTEVELMNTLVHPLSESISFLTEVVSESIQKTLRKITKIENTTLNKYNERYNFRLENVLSSLDGSIMIGKLDKLYFLSFIQICASLLFGKFILVVSLKLIFRIILFPIYRILDTCEPPDDKSICSHIITIVTVSHSPELKGAIARHEVLKLADVLSHEIPYTSQYEGVEALAGNTVINLFGVPQTVMNDDDSVVFEEVILEFLKSEFIKNSVDVTSVQIIDQKIITSSRSLRSSSEESSSDRSLQELSSSLEVTTIVTGEHNPPPDLDFESLVSDAINDNEEKISTKFQEKQAPFFKTMKSIKARSEIVKTLAPTIQPTPPYKNESSQGSSVGMILGIIIPLLVIGFGCAGYIYMRGVKHRDNKEADNEKDYMLNENCEPDHPHQKLKSNCDDSKTKRKFGSSVTSAASYSSAE